MLLGLAAPFITKYLLSTFLMKNANKPMSENLFDGVMASFRINRQLHNIGHDTLQTPYIFVWKGMQNWLIAKKLFC